MKTRDEAKDDTKNKKTVKTRHESDTEEEFEGRFREQEELKPEEYEIDAIGDMLTFVSSETSVPADHTGAEQAARDKREADASE